MLTQSGSILAKFAHLVNFVVTRVKEATAQGKQEEKRKSKGYKMEDNEEEGDEEVAKDVEKEPVMNPEEILHTASVEEKLLARSAKSNQPKVPEMAKSKQNTQYISKKLARYGKNRPSLTQQRKAKGFSTKSKGATKKKIMSMSNRNPLLEKFNDK